MNSLPNELKQKIFLNLDLDTLLVLQSVCKNFNKLVGDYYFIHNYIQHHRYVFYPNAMMFNNKKILN